MATKQGPVEDLPIAKHSFRDNKPFTKYKEEKDPLSSMRNPEISPFDIKISEFLKLSNNLTYIMHLNTIQSYL